MSELRHQSPALDASVKGKCTGMVTYVVSNGRIVFTAHVDGYGPIDVTSRRPGIFSGRLADRQLLREALARVEAFADEHKIELSEHYERINAARSAA
jgi:hypothetical protein